MTCRTFRLLVRATDLSAGLTGGTIRGKLATHAGTCPECATYQHCYSVMPELLHDTHEEEVSARCRPVLWPPAVPHTAARRGPWPVPSGLALAGAALVAWLLVAVGLSRPGTFTLGKAAPGETGVRLPAAGPTPGRNVAGPDTAAAVHPKEHERDSVPATAERRTPGFTDVAENPSTRNTASRSLPDREYLNGEATVLGTFWNETPPAPEIRRLLTGQLPPMRDDFVQPPHVLLADAAGKTTAGALKQYEKEAQVVDARLFRRVTLALKAVSLDDFCAQLRQQTGVDLRATRGVADEKVTVFVDDRPAREIMREVARLFGYLWGRSGGEGAYRYTLEQSLRSQLAEEEMRSKDVHAALIALDEKLAAYKPYLERTPEQLSADYERIKEDKGRIEERTRLWTLLNGAYGPLLLYNRLGPAERAALFAGEWLRFGSDSPDPDHRLPAELRTVLLKSSNLVMYPSGVILQKGFRSQSSTPIDQVPGADPEALLHLDRSEAGEFSLDGGTYARLFSEGQIVNSGGFASKLATGRSPSTAGPENARFNAAVRREPLFGREIVLEPKPSCPRLALTGEAAEQIHQVYWYDAEFKGPHVTSADVWEAVHARTGLPVVADSYTHLYPLSAVRTAKGTAFEALCKAGDEMGLRWRKDGEFLLARSTTYFWDKLKEVPNRMLTRWKQDSVQNGGLPLPDLLEIAELSDQQLGSRAVGLGITHCWGLDEWGIVGGGPFITGEIISAEMRQIVRNLRVLNANELAAMQQGGLPLSKLSPEKLRALHREFGAWLPKGTDDPGARATVTYVPSGWYVWRPDVTRARYETEAKRWPLVYGRTKDEVLQRARRYDPDAGEGSVRWTRGRLDYGIVTSAGDYLGTGGVSVSLSLE